MTSAKIFTELDMGGSKIVNGADGVNPTDFATVEQATAATTAREILLGDAVTIADGSSDQLIWTYSSGSSLLDLTDPKNPTVVDAGVYAVSVCVTALTAITLGGLYSFALDLDVAAEDANCSASSPPSVAQLMQPQVALAITYHIPAGGVFTATITSLDGGMASVDYTINEAVIQRIN